MKKNILKILLSGIVLVVLMVLYFNSEENISGDDSASIEESALEHARLHVDPNYVCPMHPQITDTEQSSCPICGMDLELRDSSPAEESASEVVTVSPAMINNLGVRLEHVEMGPVAQEVYASGFVEKVAKAQHVEISSKVSGKLHEIVVKQGQWVEQDDVLIRIDVENYKEIMTRYLETMDEGKINEALKMRKKLVAMGAGDNALAGYNEDEPMSDYLEIVAPFSGEVSWIMDETEQINVDDRLVAVSAPALAEIDLRSYSRIARGVKVGHRGNLSVAHRPGNTWPGRVVEVIHNRVGFFSTLRFHVEVPPGILEAGAFAGAYVDAGTTEDVIRVPSSAVIHDENSTRVIRLNADDSFEVVEVELGFEGHRWVEIKSGLEKGDHVVTRGQFLIDSEATLQAGFKRLSSQ